MIYPTVDTIGKGEFDRYSVTVAVAKAACLVKDEYSKQKEEAEKIIGNKGSDKSIHALISEELRDDKSIKTAIDRIRNGTYEIVDPSVKDAE